MKNNLGKALDHFKTTVELAKALGVSNMVVYQWSKRRVPLSRAIEIEKITNGAVLASELRPDIYN